MITNDLNISMDIRKVDTRDDLGNAAGADIAESMRTRLQTQSHLRVIFAAAPSQREMLRTLVAQEGIDWSRVTAFHMDEYIGLSDDAPQGFGLWLREAIFDRVPIKHVHLIRPKNDLEATCREYADKLMEAPIDLVLLGIGANGHLAFNDPPADFDDPDLVKVVTLDNICRRQQVDDGCFSSFADVPRRAISLTVPMLLRGDRMFCCVSGANKRDAVRSMLHDPISGNCPATALRKHPRCTIYLDRDSSSGLVERD
jgi:glucosamine-6-phosphate deaminase